MVQVLKSNGVETHTPVCLFSKGEVWMKRLAVKSKKTMKDILVGAPGFEPGTSCAQGRPKNAI